MFDRVMQVKFCFTRLILIQFIYYEHSLKPFLNLIIKNKDLFLILVFSGFSKELDASREWLFVKLTASSAVKLSAKFIQR